MNLHISFCLILKHYRKLEEIGSKHASIWPKNKKPH